jgi:hypothetical protein
MKRLFMDSEARFVPPRPRWTRCCGSSTWEGISASPGPGQQGKLTAMSGHITTLRDRYVEVIGTQFSPDAAPSSANMTMDLRSSHNLLTCRLTKVVWWYRTSPGEGTLDRQSLFGRLDWWEEIANPSPLGSQNDSRAKWVGKTTLLQSRHTTAFVEWSSAVRSKTSEIGVSCAPTDRSDLRRLNRLSELSPAMTLAGMRRLIDSDRSPASPLLVSHPSSYTRGRSVGAFSSVRRAGRLGIANGHAGNRVSDIHQGLLGCRGTNFSASSTGVQARRVMSLQRPTAAFSDLERARSRSTRCCSSGRRDVCSRRAWTAQQGLPLGSKQGDPWVPGTSQGPMEFLGKGGVVRPYLFAWPAGSDRQVRRPSPVHLDDKSRLT